MEEIVEGIVGVLYILVREVYNRVVIRGLNGIFFCIGKLKIVIRRYLWF